MSYKAFLLSTPTNIGKPLRTLNLKEEAAKELSSDALKLKSQRK